MFLVSRLFLGPSVPSLFRPPPHPGELLKKFAAAYRMFSDMDEPVLRQDVSEVFGREKHGKTMEKPAESAFPASKMAM